MRIGYLTFGDVALNYGLSLAMRKLKFEKYQITSRTAYIPEVLLFSCFWWEHLYLLADFLRKAELLNSAKRPIIIIGGFNTVNPVPYAQYGDWVVVGDGEEALPQLVNSKFKVVPQNVYKAGQQSVTYGCVPSLPSFYHVADRITRIEIARGCRFKCKFCGVSHIKPYRELPIQDIKMLLDKRPTKKVSLFAPTPQAHSQHKQIEKMCSDLQLVRSDSDIRLSDLEHLRHLAMPRVGIEGLSERLRKFVGKSYSNTYMLSMFNKFSSESKRTLVCYFILDLPDETEEDYEEFFSLLSQFENMDHPENFIFYPIFNLFLPFPNTPLGRCGVHWDRDYTWLHHRTLGGRDQRRWKIHASAERFKVMPPAKRVMAMIAIRAGEEFKELEAELTAEGAYRIQARRIAGAKLDVILRVLEHYGGVEKYCGEVQGTAPWNVVSLSSHSEGETNNVRS